MPLLENSGHRVLAPDLPGHGSDPTPVSAKPYEMYVPRVAGLFDAVSDRAILVGHSSGGMIITETFRRRSPQIKALVYVSAFLLPPDRTPRDVVPMNRGSLLQNCIEIDTAGGVSIVRKQCAKSVFYDDCSDEDAAWAISRLQPEPLIPQTSLITTADTKSDQPIHPQRFYIECLKDKALAPCLQRWMYSESPCIAVHSLNTSHSPFLSAPEALAQHLLEIERSTA